MSEELKNENAVEEFGIPEMPQVNEISESEDDLNSCGNF